MSLTPRDPFRESIVSPREMAPYHSRCYLFIFRHFIWLLFMDEYDHFFYHRFHWKYFSEAIILPLFPNIVVVNHIGAMVPCNTLHSFTLYFVFILLDIFVDVYDHSCWYQTSLKVICWGIILPFFQYICCELYRRNWYVLFLMVTSVASF